MRTDQAGNRNVTRSTQFGTGAPPKFKRCDPHHRRESRSYGNVFGVNDNEPNEILSAQKALARETVKAVADVFALKLMLASTGRTEEELETELGRLRESALYKTVLGVGELRIAQAEQNQTLLDLMVRMRRAA
jgi:hypothetical protein